MPPNPKVKALLIVNPKSRQGAEAELEEGIEHLRQHDIDVEYMVSQSAEQSCNAVRERRNELDLVIMGGGDGTISSMARTLYECKLALAILPLGTANDLARTLHIPNDILRAFDVIALNHRQRVDLGCVNGEYFFNVANMGLGVLVTEELGNGNKKRWGVFSYLRALLAAMMRHDQFRVNLTLDGQPHRLRSMQLAVGNGRYYGGGNIVDENSRMDDGKLSVYSLRPQSVWEFLTLAPLLRSGQQGHDKRTFCARAKEIEINTGSRIMEIHADGEPISQTPASFNVIPDALEVVLPAPETIDHDRSL